MVRSAQNQDISSIRNIYNHYVSKTHATFEINEVSLDEMRDRVSMVQDQIKLPWIVLEKEEQIVGYAYATK